MAQINLEEIVADFLLSNSLGKAEYPRVYQLGRKGIQDLNNMATGQARFYDVQLDRSLSGKLPEDFLNETEVFLQGDQFSGLLKDNTLKNFDYEDEEYEDNDCDNSFDRMDALPKTPRGTGGINWIGRYRIDRDKNRIYVNPDFCYSCVTVAYLGKATPTESGEWFVDELAQEAVEAYIRWKWNMDKRSIGLYEKSELERKYKKERRLAKAKLINITRSQLQDAARASTAFKVKQ